MLLRSSSFPIPSSLLVYYHIFFFFIGTLLPHYKDSSHESEPIIHLPRTRAVESTKQNLPDNKNCIPRSKVLKNHHSIKIKENDGVEGEPQQKSTCTKATPSIQELLSVSSTGLHKQVLVHEEGEGMGRKVSKLETLVMGSGIGNDGGRICGGGYGSWWDFSKEDRTDAYYKIMIEANPNNALLLGNYAKFLKEVCGDYPKAEEYFERAILANPGDGNLLSLYADLIMQTEENADIAEGYFGQAVKRAPDDCYVLASYAKFLWDAEEDEDKECQHKTDHSHKYPPDLYQGTKRHLHITAAS